MIEGIGAWVGTIGAPGLVALVVLLVLTDKLWTSGRARGEIDAMKEQRDSVVSALHEAHEINRLNAETIRDQSETLDRLADGQDVIATFIRAMPTNRSGR